jgi:hypothetical protein
MSAIIIQKGDLASTSFSNNNTNNSGGIAVRVDSASTVGIAIATAVSEAVAALPADKYVSGIQSYNAATNIITFALADGTTSTANASALVADAVAEAMAAINVPLIANDGTTILGYIKP